MPISVYPFVPTQGAPPFAFQPELDGVTYGAVVTWNVFGKRWYITVQTIDGLRIFTQAMVPSPPAIDLQTVYWENGRVYITGIVPWAASGFVSAATIQISVRGCLPEAYNGTRLPALAHDEFTLSYPLAAPPGDCTALGQGSYDIDFAQTYFKQSTLIYRGNARQFEVFSP